MTGLAGLGEAVGGLLVTLVEAVAADARGEDPTPLLDRAEAQLSEARETLAARWAASDAERLGRG